MKTIEFDIGRITTLKSSYESTVALCEEDFPRINLRSIPQVKSYFREIFSFDLPDTKINTIQRLWEVATHDSELQDALYSLLTYFKSKATLHNYINCILRHEVGGIVTLRLVDERLLMPNKQPISYNEEIIECIVNACDEVATMVANYRKESDKRCSVPC